MRHPVGMVLFVASMLGCVVFDTVFILGYHYNLDAHPTTWLIVYGMPLWIICGFLVWIVAWDSRKRWPGAGWLKRLDNVLSYKR